ncbi:MAG: beta-ketoacyl-ACP synthase I [Aquirhabdus sp.]
MRRVVITGMGIVSCLGNDRATVTDSLRNGKSGVRLNQSYVDMGMKCHISGRPTFDDSGIDRKLKRFLAEASTYGYLSAISAIADAGLTPEDVALNPRIGVIAGSGGSSTGSLVAGADAMREGGLRKVGPFMVPRTMTSTVTAAIATGLKLQGVSYAIGSACASSAHSIGNAMELIQLGKQDMVLAGGGEEEHWTQSILFDAMGAMSTNNATPETASRPYSTDRDGFVIAGGGGIVVVEALDHAIARGARIIAEIVGYGATSDGLDMVAPSGEGAVRCMKMALDMAAQHDVTEIDYLNTHGTSTPVGDTAELGAIRQVFGDKSPAISSTKSMSGHSLGAAGVQETIYCLLMMEHGFIAPSINITELDPEAAGLDIVQTTREAKLNAILSNSFGFGGTNASLIFKRYEA